MQKHLDLNQRDLVIENEITIVGQIGDQKAPTLQL